MARGHRSAWFPLLSACRFVEFDTSIICHVLVYCFSLISIARHIFKSPRICFWGTKYNVYRERVVYLHCILWRRARLWLELFASTADKFFSRVSYLPSHVFLRRRGLSLKRPHCNANTPYSFVLASACLQNTCGIKGTSEKIFYSSSLACLFEKWKGALKRIMPSPLGLLKNNDRALRARSLFLIFKKASGLGIILYII